MHDDPGVKALVAALAVSTLLAAGGAGGAGADALLPLEPCTLSGTAGALCGTLRVWEDRDARAGRQIDLRVAVIRATRRSATRVPLFYLAGGPGGAASASGAFAASVFRQRNLTQDLVFVDQRGTGASHPLTCPPAPRSRRRRPPRMPSPRMSARAWRHSTATPASTRPPSRWTTWTTCARRSAMRGSISTAAPTVRRRTADLPGPPRRPRAGGDHGRRKPGRRPPVRALGRQRAAGRRPDLRALLGVAGVRGSTFPRPAPTCTRCSRGCSASRRS